MSTETKGRGQMPNGGSDCCGECGFFSPDDHQGGWCSIRNIYSITPFWTYCDNQTHRNPEGFPVPLGPVWINGPREGSGYSRVIWKPVPSNANQIELELAFLDGVLAADVPLVDRFGAPFDTRVIEQIAERGNSRALARLVALLCDGSGGSVSWLRSAIETLAPHATLDQLQEAIGVAADTLPVAPRLAEDVDAVLAHLENLAKHTEGHTAATKARRPRDS